MVEEGTYNPLGDPSLSDVEALEAYFEQRRPVVHEQMKAEVQQIKARLDPVESIVMKNRFNMGGDGHTYSQVQVGEIIGRHRTTVGRIERRALAKMRLPLERQTP